MTIVGVHGIGKYRYFAETGSVGGAAELMRIRWDRYLHAGLYGPAAPYSGEHYVTEIAYYAHLLREDRRSEPTRELRRMEPEEKLVAAAWLKQLDGVRGVAGESLTGMLRRVAGWAVERLGERAEEIAETFVPEVAAYFASGQAAARVKACEALADTIRRRQPQVLIAHSLGSVVAYETMWANPELDIELLITLGSPLGMHNVVFERLIPTPLGGRGQRPPNVARWVNIADKDDIVATPPALGGCFTGVDLDLSVNLDWIDFHTVEKYLGSGALNEHLKKYLAI
ncbi:hypothetical protein AB0K60_36560 [Thermopolyspora sp. NPDC052614]|uniref:hypothetical protein n=1 Tax=Thermopolyspora sp. NPDC052614 TaxID=3155682 RepID=UPI00344353AC